MTRTFESKLATRERVPVLVALAGPSGGGKTYSALRIATGIQSVSPGPIYVIDTEARRALHYADRFAFQHVPFTAPYSPLDYLDAVNYCVAQGAKTIVVDSMSHEHEGPGGVLEWHARDAEALSGGDPAKLARVKIGAWTKPTAARRRLINSMIGLPCNFILCFRAKEKLRIEKGKNPENIGYQAIAGEEFVFEMTLKLLLLPGANGIPTMKSDFLGEQSMIKLPEQFKSLFNIEEPPQLTEETGRKLAEWAAGSPSEVDSIITKLGEIETQEDFETAREVAAALHKSASKIDKERLVKARDDAKARLGFK